MRRTSKIRSRPYGDSPGPFVFFASHKKGAAEEKLRIRKICRDSVATYKVAALAIRGNCRAAADAADVLDQSLEQLRGHE